jgi:hypothetical protein
MSGSAAGVCPAVHQRLVRRRAVARAVGQAVSSALETASSALGRIAQALGSRLPV